MKIRIRIPVLAKVLTQLAMFSMLAVAEDAALKPMVIKVCDAVLADKPLETESATDILRRGSGDVVEAFSAVDGQEWIAPIESIGHPFIAAAHRAFADHRPLAMDPDMIWQLLIQMAAEEVHAAPEEYRKLFADHEHGSLILEVSRDQFVMGGKDNDWPGVFAELEARIVANVPGSPAADFSHAFSTSTPREIAARRVVLLKAASPFYNYRLGTLCGIPRIELHGTVEDWRWIRERAAGLRPFNMERRVKALIPVLDEFVAAAEGKANPAFWKSYYKFASESGSSYVSGWINTFFIKEDSKALDVVLDEKFSWTAPPDIVEDLGARNMPLALRTAAYPSKGVVDVDFMWEYLGKSMPMRLRAGFMGVAQDRETMTLRPVIGWQVLHVKLAPAEREAADFLGGVNRLARDPFSSMNRRFSLDPETGHILLKRMGQGERMDSRIWKKALPLMSRLEVVSVEDLVEFDYAEPAECKAICEALLTAPAVKLLIIPANLEEPYLRILEQRKDWKIEVKGGE
jgi:Domain of unknown function (DUF4419)